MKTYNKPYTQIVDCQTRDMLMSGNVSGGGFQGIQESTGGQNIEIN